MPGERAHVVGRPAPAERRYSTGLSTLPLKQYFRHCISNGMRIQTSIQQISTMIWSSGTEAALRFWSEDGGGGGWLEGGEQRALSSVSTTDQ